MSKFQRIEVLRFAPIFTMVLFLAPVCAGLIGTWLPAVGIFPALGGEEFSLAGWHELFAYPGLGSALRLTLTCGLLSTVLSLVLVIGFVASCNERKSFRALRRFITPLLAVPHVAIAIGLAFLIAPSGWFVRLFSPWATGWTTPPDIASVQDPYGFALTAGLVVKELPFLFLMTLAAVHQTHADRRLAIARSLGYGPVTAWIKTVLPAIYPQIRLPVYAVLAFSLSVVDMAMILAPTTPPPLAVLVLRWFNDPDLSMRFVAAACASLQFGIVAAAIGGWRLLEILVARLARPWLIDGRRGGGGDTLASIFGFTATMVCGLGALSILGMALWSFTRRWRYPDVLPSAISLDSWMRQGGSILQAGLNTLSIGLASAAIATILVVACLENERRQSVQTTTRGLWLLYAPLLVPQIGFLFGTQVLAVQLNIDGTWWALVWTHLLFVLPYVFLSLSDSYRNLDERYVRSALCLGASPNRTFWRVKVPMLLRPILYAMAIGFAVSVAQYLPTLFAGGGRYVTLTTEAVSLAAGANRRVVGVFALLQATLPMIAFGLAIGIPALLYRHRRGLRGIA
ncbi:ABC transporter permease [Pelagibius sp. Alg239-R121]|uniref:ABC transporter permease n=1 Tax=Pelagibius sp. Alg239-R121 TaxID=2993448 RepID=UPI0024A6107F|nr:ABC transporter permease subunit [Pelagibius sp. Alg239-R121]